MGRSILLRYLLFSSSASLHVDRSGFSSRRSRGARACPTSWTKLRIHALASRFQCSCVYTSRLVAPITLAAPRELSPILRDACNQGPQLSLLKTPAALPRPNPRQEALLCSISMGSAPSHHVRRPEPSYEDEAAEPPRREGAAPSHHARDGRHKKSKEGTKDTSKPAKKKKPPR